MRSTSSPRPLGLLAAIPLVLSAACASMGGSEVTIPTTRSTVTLKCGDQYVWVPFEQTVLLEVPASDCWTDWATIPQQARGVSFRPEGVLDVQFAFPDGKTASFSDIAPTRRLPDSERATGVRYRNRQGRPVRVEVTLR
jgi:hypothetical protein